MGSNCAPKLGELFLHSYEADFLYLIFPNELEVKETTDAHMSASYLVFHTEVDNERKLKTKHTTTVMHFSNSLIYQ